MSDASELKYVPRAVCIQIMFLEHICYMLLDSRLLCSRIRENITEALRAGVLLTEMW